MPWPRDDDKLDRVRALMTEAELDAVVVRAPDNVLYLTNFWGMKGYDACVFPREGEPVLITIEASEEDAARMAWTDDVRLIRGYDPGDPRPPLARTLDAAVEVARNYERVEVALGHQRTDPAELLVVARPAHQRTRGGAGSPCASCQETTGLRSTPMRSISASITSPGLR